MFFVPTKLPTMTAAMTNASQPKTAVFQWLALQRPMRAAMLFERFRGDIWTQLLRLGYAQDRSEESVRKCGSQASCQGGTAPGKGGKTPSSWSRGTSEPQARGGDPLRLPAGAAWRRCWSRASRPRGA